MQAKSVAELSYSKHKKTKRKVEVKTNQKNVYDKRNAFTLQQKEAIFDGF